MRPRVDLIESQSIAVNILPGISSAEIDDQVAPALEASVAVLITAVNKAPPLAAGIHGWRRLYSQRYGDLIG